MSTHCHPTGRNHVFNKTHRKTQPTRTSSWRHRVNFTCVSFPLDHRFWWCLSFFAFFFWRLPVGGLPKYPPLPLIALGVYNTSIFYLQPSRLLEGTSRWSTIGYTCRKGSLLRCGSIRRPGEPWPCNFLLPAVSSVCVAEGRPAHSDSFM